MTKISLSQGRPTNGINDTLPKEKITLEHWVTLLKIYYFIDLSYILLFNCFTRGIVDF